MRRVSRAVLILVALLVWDSQVQAQQPISPPNAWHPYRGGANCVQVADASGNFSCSPLVTINPATGFLSLTGGSTGTQTFPGVVVAALGSTYQTLGTGDLVISRSPSTVAPAGPGVGAVTLRLRTGANGTCQLVVAGGNSFQEFVIPVLPSAGGLLPLVASSVPVFPGNALLQSYFSGGPGGC